MNQPCTEVNFKQTDFKYTAHLTSLTGEYEDTESMKWNLIGKNESEFISHPWSRVKMNSPFVIELAGTKCIKHQAKLVLSGLNEGTREVFCVVFACLRLLAMPSG